MAWYDGFQAAWWVYDLGRTFHPFLEYRPRKLKCDDDVCACTYDRALCSTHHTPGERTVRESHVGFLRYGRACGDQVPGAVISKRQDKV